MNRSTARAILPFLLVLLLISCAPRPPIQGPSPTGDRGRPPAPLRVALQIDAPDISARVEEGALLRWEGGEARIVSGETVRFEAARDGHILVQKSGSAAPLPGPVTLLPDRGAPFTLEGTPYGGTLVVISLPDGLTAVNGIGMEEYLRGVVPWEIGWLSDDRIEALKAQAVAARTYAYTRAGRPGELWDLVATESDQVYKGLTRTDPVVDKALRETAGIVATFRGKLIRTYYSSTCGGRTAPLTDVWFKRKGAPYLRGVADGPGRSTSRSRSFCRESPYFNWTERWSGEGEMLEIVRRLAVEKKLDAGRLGRLRNVRIEKTGRSKRILSVLFETDGEKVRVAGDRVRWVLQRSGGNGILRSTWFTLRTKRSGGFAVEIVAEGHGYGHGIGMCQWGAMGMADEGYSYDRILRHYYPGASLRRATRKLIEQEK